VAVAATWMIGIVALLLGGGLLAFAWRRHQSDSMVL
jgi:HAMP domain-containing protein